MRIFLVGAGAASLYFGIIHSLRSKDDEIFIIEKNGKIASKLYATGNGRCNLGNLNINEYSYNDKEFYDKYGKNLPNELLTFLDSIGVKTTVLNDGYLYPYSLSAKTYADYLIKFLKGKNVKFIHEEFISYEHRNDDKIHIKTSKNEYDGDVLIFGCGNSSSPKFGSDGKLFELFKNHGYIVNQILPGLCKIMIKEKIKDLENERLTATVYLKDKNGKEIYKEEGEVLFKKDSLSGICIFNLASMISRLKIKKCDIYVVPKFPRENFFDINKMVELSKENALINPLEGIFSHAVAKYIDKEIYHKIKRGSYIYFTEAEDVINFKFTFDSLEGFNNSQVSIGGISKFNLNNFVESKIEKNVYFIGEVVDIDGLCGGYNLMYDFKSAELASKMIKPL